MIQNEDIERLREGEEPDLVEVYLKQIERKADIVRLMTKRGDSPAAMTISQDMGEIMSCVARLRKVMENRRRDLPT